MRETAPTKLLCNATVLLANKLQAISEEYFALEIFAIGQKKSFALNLCMTPVLHNQCACAHTSYTRSDYNDASVARISTLLCLDEWQKSHKGKMKNWNKRTRRGDAFNKVERNERAEENEIINVGGKWRNRRCHRHAFPTLTWFAYNSEHRNRTRLTMLREMNIKLHLNYYFVFFVRLLSSLIRHIFEDVPSRHFRVYFLRFFCAP